MARRRQRNKEAEDEPIVDLTQVQGQATDFFEDNQNTIVGVVAGILVIIAGFWAFQNFYKAPRETTAMGQLNQAEYYFEQDSFSKALLDPGGGYPGLIDIIDQYGSTKAGNLAHYYAGISYLQLGKYEVAIDYLKDFSPKGMVTPATKNGLIGDAYSELGDYSSAVSYYKKASNALGDEFTGPYYLLKAAMLTEKQGDSAAALKLYTQLQEKYPETEQGKNAAKYIARVQAQ